MGRNTELKNITIKIKEETGRNRHSRLDNTERMDKEHPQQR